MRPAKPHTGVEALHGCASPPPPQVICADSLSSSGVEPQPTARSAESAETVPRVTTRRVVRASVSLVKSASAKASWNQAPLLDGRRVCRARVFGVSGASAGEPGRSPV